MLLEVAEHVDYCSPHGSSALTRTFLYRERIPLAMDDAFECDQGPVCKGRALIVQLYIDNRPLLRCGTVREGKGTTHGRILEDALSEFGIHSVYMPYNGRMLPATTGERYTVTGMGECDADEEVIRFRGGSAEYGLGIDRSHARQLAVRFPGKRIVCY
jgi:hypothetical protein